MAKDKTNFLSINGNPPQEIIPVLIEKWLSIRKWDRHYSSAEVSQIESIHVVDPARAFWTYDIVLAGKEKAPQRRLASPWTLLIFVNNQEQVQHTILSASTKTGSISYIEEKIKGNLLYDSFMAKRRGTAVHHKKVLIYQCLPLLSTCIYPESKDADWHSETALQTIL
jgi:hypothetical protein